jgi:hypothetical protein
MTTLFAFTPIGGENNVPVAKNSEPIDATPISKTDVNPTTQTVQDPNIVKKSNDFVPSQAKQKTFIDNTQNKDYFTNKVESPETEPIKKSDIQPQTEKPVSVPQKPQITTEPVTKDDVEGENNVQNNKLTNSYKDMMNRMDNLYNDEEENK